MNRKNTDIKERPSIKKKLFAGFLIFAVITIATLLLCQLLFFGAIYKSVKLKELTSTAGRIADNAGSNTFFTKTDSMMQKYEVSGVIIDTNGDEMFSRDYANASMLSDLSQSELLNIAEILKDDKYLNNKNELIMKLVYDETTDRYSGEVVKHAYTLDNDASIICALAVQHSGETLIIILNTEIQPVGAAVKTSSIMVMGLMLMMVILAAILATYLSHTIATPIRRITKEAANLSKGRFTPATGGCLEADRLNNALSDAAVEISKVDVLRRELIANISHDLRTPLTLITGYSEVMRDIPDEMTSENLQTVIDETERLTSLVNDLLDVSKYESGSIKPVPEQFSLTEAVETALGRYSKLTQHDGYVITFEHDNNVFVNADRKMMLQVIYNLVNNALTYTGDNKTVTVRQILKQNAVRIEVTDTGDGIEPDKLALIWDRYYKAGNSHRRAAVGSGLGLSIVKNIIILHKGNYGVRSRIGRGSTFWIEIPLADN